MCIRDSLFGLFIYCKYLLVTNRCEQLTMVVFYTLSLLDIASRTVYFITACILSQNSSILYDISCVSTVATVLTGVSHSQNLCRLIFDLAAVRCESIQQHDKLAKKRIIVHLLLALWILLTAYYIYELVREKW